MSDANLMFTKMIGTPAVILVIAAFNGTAGDNPDGYPLPDRQFGRKRAAKNHANP